MCGSTVVRLSLWYLPTLIGAWGHRRRSILPVLGGAIISRARPGGPTSIALLRRASGPSRVKISREVRERSVRGLRRLRSLR